MLSQQPWGSQMKIKNLVTIAVLFSLASSSYALPAAPKRTLTNVSDCLVNVDGSNPRLYPWVQYTVYSFLNVNGVRTYTGISIAPGETKEIQEEYDSNNQSYFDLGFSPNAKVNPFIQYYWVGYSGPGYIVRYEQNNSIICSGNGISPYVPCFGVETNDPCAAQRNNNA